MVPRPRRARRRVRSRPSSRTPGPPGPRAAPAKVDFEGHRGLEWAGNGWKIGCWNSLKKMESIWNIDENIDANRDEVLSFFGGYYVSKDPWGNRTGVFLTFF